MMSITNTMVAASKPINHPASLDAESRDLRGQIFVAKSHLLQVFDQSRLFMRVNHPADQAQDK